MLAAGLLFYFVCYLVVLWLFVLMLWFAFVGLCCRPCWHYFGFVVFGCLLFGCCVYLLLVGCWFASYLLYVAWAHFLEFVGIVYLQWLGFLADCFVVLFGLVLRLRALGCFLVWCLMLIWCFGFIACAPV